MEEGEGVDFKTLRARFQNDETLKIRTKPSIPKKPQTLSPTNKISNPLVATLNSAIENHTIMAPRVVFKDEKKSPVKRQFSQPDNLQFKVNDTHINHDLLDKKQKKEGEIVKKAFNNKNLPRVLPMSPVTPVIKETPKFETLPNSPVLGSPVEVSTPNDKSVFNFRKPGKHEDEKTDTSESALPKNLVPDGFAATNSPSVNATPKVCEPVSYKALIPPVQAEVVPESRCPAPISSPSSAISPKVVPESNVPANIVSQITPALEIKSKIPITHDVNFTDPQTDGDVPEKVLHPPEIPDIFNIIIPPPVIPEDIPDADIFAQNIPAPVTPEPPIPVVAVSATPVSRSPRLSRTASPAPTSVTPEPSATVVPSTITPDIYAASSPRTPSSVTDMKPVMGNGTAETVLVDRMKETTEVPSSTLSESFSNELLDQTKKSPEDPSSTSPKSISALSALERAEEMAPMRHNPGDQRVFNLLEKAKKKHAMSHQTSTPTTPENMTSVETILPAVTPPKSSVQPEAVQTDPEPSVEDSPGPENVAVPLADYEDKAGEVAKRESNIHTPQISLTNGFDHIGGSRVPKVLPEQTAVRVKAVPPPPPPRKTPVRAMTPEKPPRVVNTDLQNSALPVQPVEENGTIIPAPLDFTSEDSTFDDSEYDNSSEAIALDVPQDEIPEHGNPTASVHEKTFLEHLSPEHQSSEEFVPNANITESDSGLPETLATGLPVTVTDTPVIPSPSGVQEMNCNGGENIAVNKKNKTAKKQHKGAPLNPYADASIVKHATFRKSKKTANPDEKELKKKEKQKKELKEKEKEKKVHKDTEKEKEHKDKEKKEHKDKEREKDQNDKKQQKEKEREKKEQKEKEKKKNEMKKKFKITGEEEVMYQAKVMQTCKGRKDDLAVKAGDTVSIIRTTDCPKGKWLARDCNNIYGYVSVESMETDVQEMMELGRRAKASREPKSNLITEHEVDGAGRSSNHYPLQRESFTDDSEEWCDDDDTVFTPSNNTHLQLNQMASSLETVSQQPNSTHHTQPDVNDNVQARHEALQKLATFFAQPKTPNHTTLNRNTIIEESEPEEPANNDKEDIDLQILPPPDLYADIVMAESDGVSCK
ncbi:FYN-binding protein 1 [Hoplias malabaricus]|uniref:FYN-binding protein 1 n=1 Tax=Hoplias malabaricus TaxID=27720 RepID=UPI003461F5CD